MTRQAGDVDAPALPRAARPLPEAAVAGAPRADAGDDRRVVHDYHARSKHRLQAYAAGPETLDWDAPPAPSRHWTGSPRRPLPLGAAALAGRRPLPWAALSRAEPLPLDLDGVGLLMELSFALSAWKRQGPDRWAVRVTPSSGNLHPGEAWLLAEDVPGLPDGLHHYLPYEHALEHRAVPPGTPAAAAAARRPDATGPATTGPRLAVALSTIAWREAWKYGERAFRYCQLDAGHALGAIRYAAAALGWRARRVLPLGDARLAALLGLDRVGDCADAEPETPEWLVVIETDEPPPPGRGQARDGGPACPPPWPAATQWHGRASRLDRHPMYRWPVIGEVTAASQAPEPASPSAPATSLRCEDPAPAPGAPGAGAEAPASAGIASAPMPGLDDDAPATAAPDATPDAITLIRRRRSAQRFDSRASMSLATMRRLVAALDPARGAVPFDVQPGPARVHLLCFAHRVEGLAPGAYWLPRQASATALLQARATLPPGMAPAPELSPAAWRLAAHPALAGTLRTLNCHQALGSDAALAIAMLAEFDAPIESGAWHYRTLLQEAGLVGQVLYLEAEAAGLRGTGIGCYFDDALHELVGLHGTALQSLYHFTIGTPLDDPRIESAPPYADHDDRPPDPADRARPVAPPEPGR